MLVSVSLYFAVEILMLCQSDFILTRTCSTAYYLVTWSFRADSYLIYRFPFIPSTFCKVRLFRTDKSPVKLII